MRLMRRPLILALTIVLAAVLALSAIAAGGAVPPAWKNCTRVHKTYPHGVGKVGARDHTSGAPVTTFRRSNALYLKAKHLDRDRRRHRLRVGGREGQRSPSSRSRSSFASAATPAASPVYRVGRVIDGDTIELRNGQHVRLVQIDTPEVYGGVRVLRAGGLQRPRSGCCLRAPGCGCCSNRRATRLTATGGCCATSCGPATASTSTCVSSPWVRLHRGSTTASAAATSRSCRRSRSGRGRSGSGSGVRARGRCTTRTTRSRRDGDRRSRRTALRQLRARPSPRREPRRRLARRVRRRGRTSSCSARSAGSGSSGREEGRRSAAAATPWGGRARSRMDLGQASSSNRCSGRVGQSNGVTSNVLPKK